MQLLLHTGKDYQKLTFLKFLHPEKLGLFLSAGKTCKGHSWKHVGDLRHVRVMLQVGEFVLALTSQNARLYFFSI